MALEDKINEVLDNGEYLRVRKLSNGFEFEYGKEYSHPEISFAKLKALSEIFGTDAIDVDNYCTSTGCDTCGYGSNYGHTIQIYNPTKNVEELTRLVGTDLKKELSQQ
jgi:hypothetical protein